MKRFSTHVAIFILGLAIGAAGVASAATNSALVQRLKGKILLRVEHKGEAWYLNPDNGLRYFLGRPQDAFTLMRTLGLGIRDQDLFQIPTAPGNFDQDGPQKKTVTIPGRLLAFDLPSGWSQNGTRSNRAEYGVDIAFDIAGQATGEGLRYDAVGDERGPGVTMDQWIDQNYAGAVGRSERVFSGYSARVFTVRDYSENPSAANQRVVMIIGNTVLTFVTDGRMLTSGLLETIRYTGF